MRFWMSVLLAGLVDDRAAFLFHANHSGFAELVEGNVLQLHAQVFADELTSGQHGDVGQHGLEAIAEGQRALTVARTVVAAGAG